MIHYTPQNQLHLHLFEHPFEKALDPENRWVKLATVIPWDALAGVYAKHLNASSGRKSVNIRTVIAALIVKHRLVLDDRGTIEMIQENIYLQYFCGLPAFTTEPVFESSLFVDIRKRLGPTEFDKFNRLVIEKSESIKPHQSRIKKKPSVPVEDNEDKTPPSNKGTLKVDATIADQEITYPTDLKLLNRARENLERLIDLLYKKQQDGKKPRDYRRVARKDYLTLAKKKKKSIEQLRRGIKSQLQYVFRDLKHVDRLLANPGRLALLSKRDRELLATIRTVHLQQKYMYDNKTHRCPDRIVSLYQPQVRPMVRGKDKNKVEFGAKINVGEVNGFTRIDRFSWDAYNEGGDVELQVENFRQVYGRYPKLLLADGIYLNRKNRTFLKEKNIEIVGKPLGRPPKQKQTPMQKYRKRKKAAQRNHVEGKFGQGKRGYGLNNIMARLPETSESWINAIIFVMNLTKLLQIAEKYPAVFAVALKIGLIQRMKRFAEAIYDYFILWNEPKRYPKNNLCVAAA